MTLFDSLCTDYNKPKTIKEKKKEKTACLFFWDFHNKWIALSNKANVQMFLCVNIHDPAW